MRRLARVVQRHAIEARIVLGGVLIAGIVVALLSAVVSDQLRQVAGTAVANLAKEELVPIVTALHDRPLEDPPAPGPGRLVLVQSPDGGAVINTLPSALVSTVTRSGTDTTRLHAAGLSYISVGTIVVNERGTWRIWAIRDSGSADLAIDRFGRMLQLFVPVVLVIVLIGSWGIVRAALRPVRQLRTAADQIRRSGVARRLPEGNGRDELAALAMTLNGFLDAQQRSVEHERRMVADASHEMRTPLAVLMTQLELAQEQQDDRPVQDQTIAAALSQVRALARLTTQLLELSSLDSGEHGAPHASSSVADLVSETMAAVDRARTIAPPRVQVELELARDLREGARLRISRVAFGRIVDNLAANALHSTSEGVVVIGIAAAHARLVLSVLDSGTGIDPHFLPHAFDRFSRSPSSRASDVPGSGLGLALVRALVQGAGGDVQLENRLEGGVIASAAIPFDRVA